MTKETPKQPLEQIYDVRLKDIIISKDNVRQSDPTGDLDELAASIKLHGLLQPVVLLGTIADNPPYELISGQRRYLAHKKILNAATRPQRAVGPIRSRDSRRDRRFPTGHYALPQIAL